MDDEEICMNNTVEARPKLRGGSNNSEIKLVFGNIKGMPNNRNNQHKMKDVNKLLEDKDGAVLVEVAATKSQKIYTCRDDLKTVRENKVEYDVNKR